MNHAPGQNGIATLSPGKVRQEDMALRTGKMPVPLFDEDLLLEAIAEGNMGLRDIARTSGFSLLELATQVCTPRNLEALGRVARLHAMQREMLLGRLKIDALMRLAELTEEVPAASADEVRAAEIMRKACVDLLRYGGSSFSGTTHQSPPPRDDAPEPLNEEKVLEYLERLGEEKNEYEPRAQASGSVEPTSPEALADTHPLADARPDVRSSFNKQSRNGPGACASDSYSPSNTRSSLEMRSSLVSSPRNGPGASGGCASGSYSPSNTCSSLEMRSSLVSSPRNGPGACASDSYSPPTPGNAFVPGITYGYNHRNAPAPARAVPRRAVPRRAVPVILTFSRM